MSDELIKRFRELENIFFRKAEMDNRMSIPLFKIAYRDEYSVSILKELAELQNKLKELNIETPSCGDYNDFLNKVNDDTELEKLKKVVEKIEREEGDK